MPTHTHAFRSRIILAAAFLALSTWPARAQDVPLANLLPELILREIVLQSPPASGVPGVPEGFSHLAHFSPIEANDLNNPVVGIVQSFNTQMATQFATFPLGTSTGGLTYVFDAAVGTFRRGSRSFGPLFAERALTIGRRKLSAGFNYQRTSYDTFEGQSLEQGGIKFYLRHQDCCTVIPTSTAPGFILVPQGNGTRLNAPFEGDLIETSLSVEAVTHTTAFFASYGVTDSWDIGLAVPVVSVKMDAAVRARVIRLVTATNPVVHSFDLTNPAAERVVRRGGDASGLGDIVVRTKYRFARGAAGALAGAVDLRLPTGDDTDLLGTGGVQAKFLLIASSERGRFGHHASIGYTAAEGESAGSFARLMPAPLPDEINYAGGVELVATPRLTVVGDIVGRVLRDAGRLEMVSKTFEYAGFPAPPGSPGCGGLPNFFCTSTTFDEFDSRSGNLHLVLGAVGFKLNPVGNWLISGSLLFPMTDAGLRSRVTTVFGVDYVF